MQDGTSAAAGERATRKVRSRRGQQLQHQASEREEEVNTWQVSASAAAGGKKRLA